MRKHRWAGANNWSEKPLGLLPLPTNHTLDESAKMQPTASQGVPLMQREVCDRCHHMHREVLAVGRGGRRAACECCRG